MPPASGRIAGHDDVHRCLEYRLGLEPVERAGARGRQRCGEVVPRPFGQCLDPGPAVRVGDDDEVPWLREPDGRRPVGGSEHALEHVGWDWIRNEVTAYVSALFDHPVDGGALLIGKGVPPRRPGARRFWLIVGRQAWPPSGRYQPAPSSSAIAAG